MRIYRFYDMLFIIYKKNKIPEKEQKKIIEMVQKYIAQESEQIKNIHYFSVL